MSYASLRDFIDALERDRPAGARHASRSQPVLEMTEIQTRLLAEGRAGGAVRERSCARTASAYDMPVLVNLFGTVERVAAGAWTASRDELRERRRDAGLPAQPEPPGGWREAIEMLPLLKTVMAMRPKTVGIRAVPGGGAGGRRHRPRHAADPDLLARRAGAADHLAAGRDQGAGRAPRGRLQSRHLPHAGDRARHHPDALAGASRRRPAPRALEGGEARAPAGRGRDRRRSRHHPGRRDAGAGHPVGIPVRRPAARRQGRAGRLQDRAAEGAGRRPRSCSKGHVRWTTTATKARTATTPATTTRSSGSRSSRVSAITMRRDPIYLSTFTGRPPDEP